MSTNIVNALPNSVPAGSAQWKDAGRSDGSIISTAVGNMKQKLVSRLQEFQNNTPYIKDYLDGYGEAAGAARKSEANVVFKAYSTQPERVLINADQLDYTKWVKACREIVGKTARGKPAGKKVTDKGMANINDAIGVMSASQVMGLIDSGLTKLTSFPNFEALILLQIENACVALVMSEQPIYKAIADKVTQIVSEHLEELSAQEQLRKSGANLAEVQDEITTPVNQEVIESNDDETDLSFLGNDEMQVPQQLAA